MIEPPMFSEYMSDIEKTCRLLENCTISDITEIALYIKRKLGATWGLTYDLDRFVYGEQDRTGRLEYIYSLVRLCRISFNDVLMGYRTIHPQSERDHNRKMFLGDMIPVKDEEVVLTDDYTGPLPSSNRGKILQITNPRWEHKDEQKKTDTPDTAAFGDTIILKADIENYVESGAVVFDIYDSSVKPPRKVASANGRNTQGTGQAEWVVTDTKTTPESTYEFEALAKGKNTERCPVALVQLKLFVPSF